MRPTCSCRIEIGQSGLTATRPVSHPEDMAAGNHSGMFFRKTAVETMFAAGINCYPEANRFNGLKFKQLSRTLWGTDRGFETCQCLLSSG